MSMNKCGDWICHECGIKYGRKVVDYATYHYDKCEYCNKDTSVTSTRDFGYPDLPGNKNES
jgi:hypothetical protein